MNNEPEKAFVWDLEGILAQMIPKLKHQMHQFGQIFQQAIKRYCEQEADMLQQYLQKYCLLMATNHKQQDGWIEITESDTLKRWAQQERSNLIDQLVVGDKSQTHWNETIVKIEKALFVHGHWKWGLMPNMIQKLAFSYDTPEGQDIVLCLKMIIKNHMQLMHEIDQPTLEILKDLCNREQTLCTF